MKKLSVLIIMAAISSLLKAQTITIPRVRPTQPNTLANNSYYNLTPDSTLLQYAPILPKAVPRSLFNGAANNIVTYNKRLTTPLIVTEPVSKMLVARVSSDDKMPVAKLYSDDRMPVVKLGGSGVTYVLRKNPNESDNPDSVKFEKTTP